MRYSNWRNEFETQAFQNLLDFKLILDDLGVEHFLDGGTLLGFYRDNGFCKDDETDIDIGSYSTFQNLIPQILDKAREKGFGLHMWWKGDRRASNKAQEIAVFKKFGGKKLKIDLFFYERIGEWAWTGVYDTVDHLTPRVVPYKHIENLDILELNGTKFAVPNNIEEYLTLSYGDWKTPVHRKDYSCYNPDQLKVLRPDFKFWEQ